MSDDVAVCPRCDGDRRVFNKRSGQSENCPTCKATGVVWRSQEGAEQPAYDEHHDLTYRGSE